MYNVMFDMDDEYYCYASDITCSFPANMLSLAVELCALVI